MHALTVTVTNFNLDQVAMGNALGGLVAQIGGATPGVHLSAAGDFGGAPNCQSGVDVTLRGWSFLNTASYINGSIEPGNFGFVTVGSSTDITFTTPGTGGPDGTDGDGSLQLLSEATLTGSFVGTLTTATGVDNDIFIFTNSAGRGKVDINFLLGATPVASIVGLTLAAASAGQGTGGAILNIVSAGLRFDTISLIGSGPSGSLVEIDAIAAFDQISVVPVPVEIWFFASVLLALSCVSRRFKTT